MRERIRNITIAPSNEYVIWDVNLENIVRDTELTVGAGCVGIYIVNGVLKSVNTPGRWVINSKDEERSRSSLQLIGVNSDKVFEIFCGVGNIPWHDYVVKIDGKVGAHGDCKLRISSPWSLYTAFGHAPITAAEIDEFAKAKLMEIMSSHIAAAIEKYDYEGIISAQSAISADLEKKIGEALFNFGLEVASFSIRGINFNQEYLDKRQWHFDNKNRLQAEEDAQRAEERRRRAELAAMASLKNSVPNAPQTPPTPVTPAAPTAPAGAARFCSQCGTKHDVSAKFCPGCGRRVD